MRGLRTVDYIVVAQKTLSYERVVLLSLKKQLIRYVTPKVYYSYDKLL